MGQWQFGCKIAAATAQSRDSSIGVYSGNTSPDVPRALRIETRRFGASELYGARFVLTLFVIVFAI
jgi:hypothetical protein